MNAGKRPVILDGSIGDVLKERGVEFESSKLWAASLLVSSPHRLAELSKEYLDAGADVVTTATYQTTQQLFENEFRMNKAQAVKTLQFATKLLTQTRNTFWDRLPQEQRSNRRLPKIAASIGPLASWMDGESEYQGTYNNVTQEMFEHSHRLIAQQLISPDEPEAIPDILAFETIPSEQEAMAIIRVMNAGDTLSKFPYWISFQCRDGRTLANGTSLEHTMNQLLDMIGCNLVAVGVNCTSVVDTENLITCIRHNLASRNKENQVKLLAYPNGYCKVNWAKSILEIDADIVGGCCGTDPSYIHELSSVSTKPT